MMLQHVDDRSDHSSSQLTAITRSETLERAFNGRFEQGAMGKFTEDALHEEESRHYGEANVRQEVKYGREEKPEGRPVDPPWQERFRAHTLIRSSAYRIQYSSGAP